MNRYESERNKIPRPVRRGLQRAFQKGLSASPRRHSAAGAGMVYIPTEGPLLRCLVSVVLHEDGTVEDHISVSRGPGVPPPSWSDLVLVRALAWPDSAKVVQVFPPLTGEAAEPWINVPGVEVLHLRRYRTPARAGGLQ